MTKSGKRTGSKYYSNHKFSGDVQQEANQANIGCVIACVNYEDQYQVAGANVVGGGSGYEYSAEVEQAITQSWMCVEICANIAKQDQVS